MTTPPGRRPTHDVTNQVPPIVGRDITTHPALVEGMTREGAGWAVPEVADLGRLGNSEQWQQAGRLANEHPPVLHTHDRYGNRVDEVEYLPQYHDLMAAAVEHGLHGAAWADDRPGAHVARAAKMMAWGVTDAGHLCPVSMTYSVVPALRAAPELAAAYEPLLTNRHYDRELRAPLTKAGLIAGMSMTEKQGGSDVRANTTRAVPNADGSYALTGHKWFTSAPMSDVFLTLAQAPGGLSCFLVPRVLPDGTRNAFFLQRLKDKLGNRSNASSEVEYDGTLGWLVGDEGRGVATIIEMVTMTRLDCALMAAGGMRLNIAHALHHATHRRAFGRRLADQPAMTNVLADLAVDAEAATTLVLRVAGAVDRATRGDDAERSFRRVALAVTKYYLCKRLASHTVEALECLGGNGYVEDSGMPRLYREAPLISIWEGSGNVAALDTVRAMARQPAAVTAFLEELDLAVGVDSRYDDALAVLHKELAGGDPLELQYRARYLVERMALLLQGSLLLRHGDPAVGDAFVASRLAGDWGTAYGTLPAGVDTAAVLARAAVPE
ncbi:putative acyl-CoA dehydrogenase [Jatrophihabitans endophyticus]|uniref:Putative acyl-CoA dehydrogenase n=1 Tax=Jatrophihabitans endophyticus TaxID=1206085 RepID=A0A1M5C1D3_9ACTN|nr:acyl-CoA dehydrogenase family protein [Jatrophihabitans endophyticus]SHF48558.1 putative acyl-CoA dehydrogenase [Jatrophihabitans endophyticus]